MRVILKNTTQSKSFLFVAFDSFKVQTEVYVDDIPIPTLDPTQTLLMNFGGEVRRINVSGRLMDSDSNLIGSPYNGDLSLGTNSTPILYTFPDQFDFLNKYFPTTNPTDTFELDLVSTDTTTTYDTFTGLVSNVNIELLAGAQQGTYEVMFENGSNIAGS